MLSRKKRAAEGSEKFLMVVNFGQEEGVHRITVQTDNGA